MARLSEYNFDICVEICQKVSEGQHIKTVLDSSKTYPDFSTWCRWKRDNDELYNLYTRSIQDKAEMVLFEIEQTMREMRMGKINSSEARVIIDTLKWMAAKFYPKMFGDKIDITSKDEKIQTQADPLAVIREYIAINKEANNRD